MDVKFNTRETELKVSATELLLINKALGLMSENEDVHPADRKGAEVMVKTIRTSLDLNRKEEAKVE